MAAPVSRDLSGSDLELFWEEAEARFERLTSKKLKSKSPKTLDDVIREIEARKMDDNSSEGNEKKKRMRQIGERVLTCVQLLGGIVAEGASMVWGPAGLCFNAVSFLIAIPGKVNKIYDTLNELFDRVAVCLSQFKIYERIEQYQRLDPALLSTTRDILASFVNICALSIKLLDGGKIEKIKQTFQVSLFDGDAGTRAELEKLLLLTQTESAIVGSLTLESVLENKNQLAQLLTNFGSFDRKLDRIVADENARTMDDRSNKQLQSIGAKLDIEDTYSKAHKDNINERLIGTGKWLDIVSDYAVWEDRDSSIEMPVLLLIGEENFGKSLLTTAVISRLQARYKHGEDASTRTYVAFYYFPKENEKPNQKLLTVENALKCMSFQLAHDDKVYQKDMASLCESKDLDIGSLDLFDLWKALRFESSKTDVTYFLIFDGIDQVAKKSAKQLLQIVSALGSSNQMGQLQLRIMLSGRTAVFEEETLKAASRIQLGDHNTPDIENYIRQELEKMDALQGDDAERSDLRSEIQAKLPQKVGGDFLKVRTAFDDFKQAKFLEEIKKILDGDEFDRETFLKKEIEKYDVKLSADDIEDLNELLAWVVYGETYLSVPQLEVALFLRHDKTSLQPLKSRLKKEYSLFFTIDRDGYVINQPECTDLITTEDDKEDDEEDRPNVTPKQEAEAPITAAEVRMVDQLILRICGKEIYDRFAFEEFFERKGNHRSMIGMSESQAQLIIVKSCLKLLTSDDDQRTKPLVSFALEILPNHLNKTAKVKNISAADKRFIEKKLLMLLTDLNVIERYWECSSDLYESWVNDSEATVNVWHWMRDSVEIRDLYAVEDDWFRTAAWSEEPGLRLLKPVVRVMAKRWLQSRDFPVEGTRIWVQEYLVKTCVNDPFLKVNFNGSLPEDLTDISVAVSWSQEALGVEEPDSLWYERIGFSYLECSEYASALDFFNKAKSKDPSNWMADEGMAFTFGKYRDHGDNYRAAIEVMETVLTVFRQSQDLQERYPTNFVRDLQCQARWLSNLGGFQEAKQLYQEAILVNESAYECIHGLLSVLESLGEIKEAQELLDRMHEKSLDAHGNTRLVAMHHGFALDDERDSYFAKIFLIAQKGRELGRHCHTIQCAIDVAKRKEDYDLEGALLFYLGCAFARDEKRSHAVQRWHDCLTVAIKSDSHKVIEAGAEAFRRLSTCYYNDALQANRQGGDPTTDLGRLVKLTEAANTEGDSYTVRMSNVWRKTCQIAGLLLGRYYALTGNVDKARVHFKKDMQAGLDLLSDEDLDYDWMGYMQLAETLMHFGDDLNALSAYSMVVPVQLKASLANAEPGNEPEAEAVEESEDGTEPTEHDSDKPEAEDATRDVREVVQHDDGSPPTAPFRNEEDAPASSEKADTTTVNLSEAAAPEGTSPATVVVATNPSPRRWGTLHYDCDGGCGTRWSHANDIYCCKYCRDIQFDARCLERLRVGALTRQVCSADHEFLHVPPWSDEAFREVGWENVRVGGKVVDGVRVGGDVVAREEWLDSLRVEWGLPKPVDVQA